MSCRGTEYHAAHVWDPGGAIMTFAEPKGIILYVTAEH